MVPQRFFLKRTPAARQASADRVLVTEKPDPSIEGYAGSASAMPSPCCRQGRALRRYAKLGSDYPVRAGAAAHMADVDKKAAMQCPANAIRRPTRPSAFPRRAQLIGGPLAIFQLVEQLEHVLGKRRVLAQIIAQFLADRPNPRLIVIFRHAAECPLLLLSCRLRSLTNTVSSRSKKGG
jgi:hypothetical protein